MGCVDRDAVNVWLKVQALPCSLTHIKAHAELRQDNTRGIIVAKHPVGYNSFSGNSADGCAIRAAGGGSVGKADSTSLLTHGSPAFLRSALPVRPIDLANWST